MGALRAFQGLQGTIGQPTAQVINGSLKFKGGQYLERTSTAGNQTTWTWSGWIKTSDLSGNNIFGEDGGYPNASASFNTSGVLRFTAAAADSSVFLNVIPSAQFRDLSAWYHFVIVYDSGNAVASERARVYVNGSRLTDLSTATYPSQSATTVVNSNGNAFRIGSHSGVDHLQGYMSQCYFIDGLVLGPGYFGFTDPLTNTWRPKKFRAEGTTVNDGTVWSSGTVTGTAANGSGSGGWAQAFDGNVSNLVYPSDSNGSTKLVLPKPIPFVSNVKLYAGQNATSGTDILVNGINLSDSLSFPLSGGWLSIDHLITSPITSLELKNVGGQASNIRALEIDGVIVTNSTTTNLDFGTNGFYLPMDDEDRFRLDQSGKNNHFSEAGWSGTSIDPDVVKDSPSGAVFGGRGQTGITTTSSAPSNYCTWNPLTTYAGANYTLSDGSLKAVKSGGNVVSLNGTIGVSYGDGGKFYYEADHNSSPTQGQGIGWGNDQYFTYTYGTGFTKRLFYKNTSVSFSEHDVSGSTIASGLTSNFGKTLGVAFDLDENTMSFYVDGVLQATATGVWGTYFDTTDRLFPFLFGDGTGNNGTIETNFGQRPFKYAPPQGYLPLNSASVRTNKVIPRPDQYVGVTTFTGNGSTQSIDVGHEPDLIWLKDRDDGEHHGLFDTIRGPLMRITSDYNYASTSRANTVTSFNDNGVTLGSAGEYNGSDDAIVAWSWRAGGSKNTFNVDDVGYATAAAAGLTGTNYATLIGASVGTKQGFSIIRYQGGGNYVTTVSHGLLQAPQFMLIKNIDDADDWTCYHEGAGNSNYLTLNSTAAATDGTMFNDTTPTSTVFTLGAAPGSDYHNRANRSGYDYIAYLWHDVPGLQKFGSYVANGGSTGPVINCGFRPRLVWVKRSSSSDDYTSWSMFDTERDPFNAQNRVSGALYANKSVPENRRGNASTEEGYESINIHFLSNGFQLMYNGAEINGPSSTTYIYAAWAEAPASNLFGGQSNAR